MGKITKVQRKGIKKIVKATPKAERSARKKSANKSARAFVARSRHTG